MAAKLKQAENWQDCPVYLPARYCQAAEAGVYSYESLAQLVRQLFAQYDCLVFFCACGIAVRMIGPLLRSKYSDPAVVVCDEGGQFAISLLSGHMGGANAFTAEIADVLGAVPVITTATDVQGVFAVDSWRLPMGDLCVGGNKAAFFTYTAFEAPQFGARCGLSQRYYGSAIGASLSANVGAISDRRKTYRCSGHH